MKILCLQRKTLSYVVGHSLTTDRNLGSYKYLYQYLVGTYNYTVVPRLYTGQGSPVQGIKSLYDLRTVRFVRT